MGPGQLNSRLHFPRRFSPFSRFAASVPPAMTAGPALAPGRSIVRLIAKVARHYPYRGAALLRPHPDIACDINAFGSLRTHFCRKVENSARHRRATGIERYRMSSCLSGKRIQGQAAKRWRIPYMLFPPERLRRKTQQLLGKDQLR